VRQAARGSLPAAIARVAAQRCSRLRAGGRATLADVGVPGTIQLTRTPRPPSARLVAPVLRVL